MAEQHPAPALCPPHYWLITNGKTANSTEVWTCRRCGMEKELDPAPAPEAPPEPNVWPPPPMPTD